MESGRYNKRLEGAAEMEELTGVCKAAVWCIDLEDHRPSMGAGCADFRGNSGGEHSSKS